jgi:ElaB/YqjD/DUF883 family membrane-anchored ribosome-binding protein
MADVNEKIKENLKHIKEDASHYAERAGEGIREFREKMHVYREGANEFLDSMSTYIKENPQRSALITGGIGLGLGIILGLLMRGGRRDR